MTDYSYKKYTKNAQIGIRGESFLESIISQYCLPHRVSGSKDIGVDLICEWVHGEKPTGVLFAIQVKTTADQTITPASHGISELNKLEQFKISNSNFTIDENTLAYLEGLGIPTYLFTILIRENDGAEEINVYYKRFTPIITANSTQTKEYYYKANHGDKFLAYGPDDNKQYGFARDLFIDYMRWNYHRGSIAYLNPKDIGLDQFPEDGVFIDLFSEYGDEILSTYTRTTKYLLKSGKLKNEA